MLHQLSTCRQQVRLPSQHTCHTAISKPWLAGQLRVFHVTDGIPAASTCDLKALRGGLLD